MLIAKPGLMINLDDLEDLQGRGRQRVAAPGATSPAVANETSFSQIRGRTLYEYSMRTISMVATLDRKLGRVLRLEHVLRRGKPPPPKPPISTEALENY